MPHASYAVGEAGTATVTLRNTGAEPLTDLYAGCDPGGFGQELDVPHEQWGAFDPWHPAGKLAPGERDVTAPPYGLGDWSVQVTRR